MAPKFSVLTTVHNPEREHLDSCLASVKAQSLGDFEHVLVDDGSTHDHVRPLLQRAAAADLRIRLVLRAERGGICAASADALGAASGEFVALLDHDDEIDPDALLAISEAIGSADLAYSDHDVILPDGRLALPYYKPDFSPEQLRNHNYILHLVAARRSLVTEVGGFRAGFDGAQDHDLLLRLTEQTTSVVHVPRVLYHWRRASTSVAADASNKPWAYDSGQRAVAEHCSRIGVAAVVGPGIVSGTYHIERRLERHPLVSVVIPTRGSSRRVWGVQRCFVAEAVQSLVENSTYQNLEFVVVYDDATPEPVLAALRRTAGDRLRLVQYSEPFNFSRKINIGVAASTGELLLMLNDDTEIIEPASIEVLAAHLQMADVGMVGAKLLFADGTIQDAGHVYSGHLLPGLTGWPGDSAGPSQLRPLAVEREVSGVTAAVAMVRRADFDEVGGFDESMPVNFNDVDFSLKIRALGRRIIWTPAASWHHFESQTRAPEASDEEFRRIDDRWHHEINHDPYYNRNLQPYRADWLERPFRSGAPVVEPAPSLRRWIREMIPRYFCSPTGGIKTGRLWAASAALAVGLIVVIRA